MVSPGHPSDDFFTATAQPDQTVGNAHNVAVFAFTVHPDEKDVRVAISKQNILLSTLLCMWHGAFPHSSRHYDCPADKQRGELHSEMRARFSSRCSACEKRWSPTCRKRSLSSCDGSGGHACPGLAAHAG